MATFPSTSVISRVLTELRAAFIKDVRVYLRYPSWIASEFVTLPAWFVLFAIGVASWAPKGKVTATLGTGSVFTYFYWGFIFLIVFSTAIWGIGQTIRTEQLQGTLEQLFLAPISRVTLISGRFARVFLTDMGIIAYITILLELFTHETIVVQNLLALVVALALVEVAVLGFGLFFAALTFRIKSFNLLSNLTQFVVIGLCGLFFPLNALPFQVRVVSLLIPFTYLADLMRYAAVPGWTPIFPAGLEYLVALALGMGLFAGGLFFFKNTERRAQQRGGIGTH